MYFPNCTTKPSVEACVSGFAYGRKVTMQLFKIDTDILVCVKMGFVIPRDHLPR